MKARKIFVITISLVSSIFFAGCSSHQTKKLYEKPVKQEASMRIRGMVKMLDTVKSIDQNSIQINQNVFEGLYRYDKKGHLVLAGAKSEKTEDGGKVRIYRLRKDTRWSNGDPVVAQDYVYAWKKLLSLKESASNWTNLLILKNAEEIHDGQKDMESLGVQALDDHTLRVELIGNIPYYKEIFASTAMFPQNHAVAEKYGDDYGKTSESTVFNGPFTVKGMKSGSKKWELVKNKNYWGKKDVKLKRIKYVVERDQPSAQKDFFKGKCDYVRIGCSYDEKLASKKEFHKRLIPEVSMIRFNQKRMVTGNVHFRRAVTYAIDRKKIAASKTFHVKALYGIVPANYSYSPENDVDYREDAGNIVGLDKKKAQNEWKQAQKEIGRNQVTLTLMFTENMRYSDIARKIKKDLETTLPGLQIKIKMVGLNEKLERAFDRNYDMFYLSWQPGYVDPLAFIVNGGMEHLREDYHNPDYLNNLKKAAACEGDFSKRRGFIIAAEKDLIGKDAFVAPLFQQGNGYLLNPKLRCVGFVPYGSACILRDAWIKK